MAEIKILERRAVYPHDTAALVKVTKDGLEQVIETLRGLKTVGHEVAIQADANIEQIVFKLVEEIE